MELVQLHVGILSVTALVIVYTDHLALRWVLGKSETLPYKKMHRLHVVVWAGLLGMIVTGAVMAWPGREYYLQHTPFIIKMCFVGVLVGNALVIGRLSKVASSQSFASLSTKQKYTLLISGAISSVCWIGAFVVAEFFL